MRKNDKHKKVRLPALSKVKSFDIQEDTFAVSDILKNERNYEEFSFMSEMIRDHKSEKDIKEAYEQRFGHAITKKRIQALKDTCLHVFWAQTSENMGVHIAQQLVDMDKEMREAWDYWETSKKDKRKCTRRVVKSTGLSKEMNFETEEMVEEVVESIGDLEALKAIDRIQSRKMKLLGMEQKKQQDIGGNAGLPNVVINVVGTQNTVVEQQAETID